MYLERITSHGGRTGASTAAAGPFEQHAPASLDVRHLLFSLDSSPEKATAGASKDAELA